MNRSELFKWERHIFAFNSGPILRVSFATSWQHPSVFLCGSVLGATQASSCHVWDRHNAGTYIFILSPYAIL